MRFVTYAGSEGPRAAVKGPKGYVDLHDANSQLPASLREFLALGPAGLEAAAQAAQESTPISSDGLRLLAPIPDPQKVICVGLNYADHARESGVAPPEEPVIFNKFPTTVIGPDEPIKLPAVSKQVDYEAELVIVIGRQGHDIPRTKALDYVAGYCPGHDVSARDWQLNKPAKQWLLGKSFDTFAPFGPELVTPDESGDPNNLDIRLRLNGETLQDSNTNQFIFNVAELIAYVSQVCTLLPGDVIFTGTPPGVGFARNPPIFLKAGDVVEVEIQNLGVLRNPVVDA